MKYNNTTLKKTNIFRCKKNFEVIDLVDVAVTKSSVVKTMTEAKLTHFIAMQVTPNHVLKILMTRIGCQNSCQVD